METRQFYKSRIKSLLGFGLLLALAAVTLALTVQATARSGSPSSGPPVWGTDYRVNPPPVVTPSGMRNTVMSLNPTNSNKLVAAYEDSGYALRQSSYAWSTDAGRTWGTGSLTDTWGIPGYTPFGDLNVAHDGHGTAYLSTIAISNTTALLAVLTSTTGITWNTPNIAVTSTYTEYRSLTSMAVDQRTSGPYAGGVYLFYVYTDITANPYWRGIWMRSSQNGARTWSANDIQISDTSHYTSSLVTAAVAPNGTVYAAFEYMPSFIPFDTHELYLDRSTDGGQTWGTDRLITGAPIQYAGGPDWKYRELVLMVDTAKCAYMLRLHHNPSMVVSPFDSNTVYVAWTDSRWETSEQECDRTIKHSDVAFSKTTDGGLTWTAPKRLNDDTLGNGVDQFQPTLAVATDGTLGVTWYDRRYDPHAAFYDLAYSQSTDGGISWSASQRVSDVTSDPNKVQDVKSVDELGFRQSLLFGPDYAIASWLDTRLGTKQGDLFIDRGTFAVSTATPTRTATSFAPSTSTSTSTNTPFPTNTSTFTNTPIPTNTPTSTNTPSNTPLSTTTSSPTNTPVSTPTPCLLQFNDVASDNPFYTYIRCLACRGIINGYEDGTFRPANPVTRGQLSKIVANAANLTDPPGAQLFEDVAPGSTFYTYIQRLAALSYISGYPCGNPEPCISPLNLPYFRPNNDVTRGQITKIVANAANLTDPPGAQLFEDVAPGSTFFDFVQRLANRSVMSGYPCGSPEPCVLPGNRPYFRPNAGATRGQVAKIVSNTFFPGCTP